MAKILIPTPLRKFTNQLSSFESTEDTVSASIQALTSSYPDLRKHLLDKEGNLRKFIRVYVGDEDINALDGAQTQVSGQSQISIIPAIAGGIYTQSPKK